MSEQVIEEFQNRYSEWLEMAGDNSHELLAHLLSQALIKERVHNQYLQRRLDVALEERKIKI